MNKLNNSLYFRLGILPITFTCRSYLLSEVLRGIMNILEKGCFCNLD